MKKLRYLWVWFLTAYLSTAGVFWAADSCETKSWYDLYTCRIQQVCEVYKPQKPTFKTTPYKEAKTLSSSYIGSDTEAPALGEAKKIYRENIGTIYKCVMIQAQKNALDFLKDQLKAEKSGKIDDTIGRQIEQQMNKLDLTRNTLKCSSTEKDQFTVKKNLLDETTYEMCKYVSYLTYLRDYYANTENVMWLNQEWANALFEQNFQTSQVAERIEWIQGEIATEINHTYKVFPLVFHAYSEYENNFPIHFMLEVIHADFLLLRQKMYEVIMPIAQVGYKIINAMSN